MKLGGAGCGSIGEVGRRKLRENYANMLISETEN